MRNKPLQKLTDEQKKLAEDNIRLVYAYLARNNLNHDEWFDIILFGYTRAMAFYDPTRGEVATLAFRAMQNAYNMEMRKRMCRPSTVSLNNVIFEDSDGSELCFEDAIADTRYTSDESTFIYYLHQVLTDEEYKLIEYVIAGERQEDIAKRLGIAQSYASRLINKIRKKLIANDCMYGRFYA